MIGEDGRLWIPRNRAALAEGIADALLNRDDAETWDEMAQVVIRYLDSIGILVPADDNLPAHWIHPQAGEADRLPESHVPIPPVEMPMPPLATGGTIDAPDYLERIVNAAVGTPPYEADSIFSRATLEVMRRYYSATQEVEATVRHADGTVTTGRVAVEDLPPGWHENLRAAFGTFTPAQYTSIEFDEVPNPHPPTRNPDGSYTHTFGYGRPGAPTFSVARDDPA